VIETKREMTLRLFMPWATFGFIKTPLTDYPQVEMCESWSGGRVAVGRDVVFDVFGDFFLFRVDESLLDDVHIFP